jgi:hypothetical protein
MRLHDGTFHHTTLIEGDASYTALMRQLATGTVNRTPDHFDSSWKKLRYLKSRASRLANKLAGRPATPETAILATMVSKLTNATQTCLGSEHAVIAAVLSSPDRIAFTDEELGDVFRLHRAPESDGQAKVTLPTLRNLGCICRLRQRLVSHLHRRICLRA